MENTQLCYLLILIIAICFLIWGFMDLLKKKQPYEKTQTDVISRQIRGFALIMVSQIVLLLGSAICYGFMGGFKGVGKMISKMGTF